MRCPRGCSNSLDELETVHMRPMRIGDDGDGGHELLLDQLPGLAPAGRVVSARESSVISSESADVSESSTMKTVRTIWFHLPESAPKSRHNGIANPRKLKCTPRCRLPRLRLYPEKASAAAARQSRR